MYVLVRVAVGVVVGVAVVVVVAVGVGVVVGAAVVVVVVVAVGVGVAMSPTLQMVLSLLSPPFMALGLIVLVSLFIGAIFLAVGIVAKFVSRIF